MNTERSTRIRAGVLAAVFATSITVFAAGATSAIPVQPKDQIAVVNPHQGPGVGSVKSAPFHDAAYEAYVAKATKKAAAPTAYYHTTSGKAVDGRSHQGPGPWSSKTPGAH